MSLRKFAQRGFRGLGALFREMNFSNLRCYKMFADGTGSQSRSNYTNCPTGWPRVGSTQPLLFLLCAHLARKVSSIFQHVFLSSLVMARIKSRRKPRRRRRRIRQKVQVLSSFLCIIVKTEILRKPTQTNKMKIDMKKRRKRKKRRRRKKNSLTLMTTFFPR